MLWNLSIARSSKRTISHSLCGRALSLRCSACPWQHQSCTSPAVALDDRYSEGKEEETIIGQDSSALSRIYRLTGTLIHVPLVIPQATDGVTHCCISLLQVVAKNSTTLVFNQGHVSRSPKVRVDSALPCKP